MIPVEIVDRILSSLHTDQDYSSLESCSVVFPLLVDRHLYSQITFYISGGTLLRSSYFDTDDTYVVDSTVFSRTLFDHPHILNCVRDVRIILVTLRPLDQHLQVISAILSILTHIESLTLTTAGPLTLWPALGPEFCAAFQNSLRLPSIKKVAISKFNGFSLNSFKDCKTLTNLRLHDLEFVDGRDISTPPYPRLSSLHLTAGLVTGPVVSWVKSTLHTLSLCVNSRFDFPKFRILIAACSASLVNLELSCADYYGGSWIFCDGTGISLIILEYFNFTHSDHPQLQLSLLEHIIFRCSIFVEDVIGANFFGFNLLVPFLTTISNISSASPIRLTLHIGFNFCCTSATPIPDWSNITNILVLPIFRHPIEFHITYQSWEQEVGTLLVDSLEQHSDVKKLLVDGTLVLIKGKAPHGYGIHLNYPDLDPHLTGTCNGEVSSSHKCSV